MEFSRSKRHRKCPSSMTFQSGLSKRRLLDAIENGTSIGAPFFQHHRHEKPVCSCEATIRPPNPDRQRDVLDTRSVEFSVLLIKDQNENLTFRKRCQQSITTLLESKFLNKTNILTMRTLHYSSNHKVTFEGTIQGSQSQSSRRP